MSRTRWAIITGEYPPQAGGVSDYTRLVARGLAAAGDEVDVWAPACLEPTPADVGVTAHRLPGRFGPRDMALLSKGLDRIDEPYRLLVQYVPHAFGCKGMNVPFCWWLSRRPEPTWVMFHEVAFPLSRKQPLTHNALGVVTRLMAFLVARRADRIFVSIPAWKSLLPRRSTAHGDVTWLPVPSNIATSASAQAVSALREQIASAGELVFGHFGTYGSHVASCLARLLPPLLLKDSRRRAYLMGAGSQAFAATLVQNNPTLRARVCASGPMGPDQMAVHLAACDCLVQPYPDGVSSRRGSIMAGLALGLPIVTNAGHLTDSVWTQTRAVELAPSHAPTSFLAAVDNLLAEPHRLTDLRRRAREAYEVHFALARTIEVLRGPVCNLRLAS